MMVMDGPIGARRRRARGFVPAVLALALFSGLLAGCGLFGSGGNGPGDEPGNASSNGVSGTPGEDPETGATGDGQPSQSPSDQEQASGCPEGSAGIVVYFLRLNDAGEAETVPVNRCAESGLDRPEERLRTAIRFLQQGPNAAERAEGLHSQMRNEVSLLDVEIRRPYVRLNFDAAFEQIGGTMAIGGLLEQIARTATELPGVAGVILEVEGERTGTRDHPFTGDGFLFDVLTGPAGDADLAALSPSETLDLFIVSINVWGSDHDLMWRLLGPRARARYGSPEGVEITAWSEGLGAWRDYEVVAETIDGDVATVTIAGEQVLEGERYPDASYTAHLVREDGRWKWELPPSG